MQEYDEKENAYQCQIDEKSIKNEELKQQLEKQNEIINSL